MVSIYSFNKNSSIIKKQYESDSGPFEDEVYIRNLFEQQKNNPIFRGAFMKVNLNLN
jgi:hypothetical protein